MKEIIAGICVVVVVLFALVFAFGSWGTVETGHRGIVLRMGAVTGEIKGEGFYGKTPWLESVVEMNVQVQKEQVATEGASKDLQTVSAVVALNMSLDPAKCAEMYRTVGVDYLNKIVAPAMQESIKACVARYTAEELISKREIVRQDIATLIASKLNPMGIMTEALNIVDFDFSESFNTAIEMKVTAEQNALAAKNKLEQIRFEAEQKVAEAKGKAEAITIESAALLNNPQVLQLRALEKWDGKMPMVMGGGALPFIHIDKLNEERVAAAK